MPGVLIVEALAQAGGVLMLNGTENTGNKLVFFMAINNVKFRKPVVPGDQLILDVRMVTRRSKVVQIRGEALVDGVVVAEGDFTAALVDRDDTKVKSLPK
jgi:3-hydroxymyristoyl/3-hydroxydecanoyl-(acyl carrier protein) dehydratase